LHLLLPLLCVCCCSHLCACWCFSFWICYLEC
jgi:hypothetical protein